MPHLILGKYMREVKRMLIFQMSLRCSLCSAGDKKKVFKNKAWSTRSLSASLRSNAGLDQQLTSYSKGGNWPNVTADLLMIDTPDWKLKIILVT